MINKYLHNSILKLIFIVLVYFVIGINITWAEKCEIKNAPSEILIRYQKVLQAKITDATANKSTITEDNSFTWRLKTSWLKLVNDFRRLWRDITRIFNWWWNWGGYHTYWNFYVVKPFYHSIPYPIRRDHDLLKNESDKLWKLEKFLIKKWRFDQATKITELINLNNQVLNCFRQQIVDLQWCTIDTFWWQTKNKLIWNIPLFIKKFNAVYNTSLINKCWTQFWDEILEKFKSISETLSNNWSAFEDWQEAWLMITWTHPNMEKLEKDILIKELQRQWLSSDAINKMVKNLDKMNKCLNKVWQDWSKETTVSCVAKNNPFTNTYSSITWDNWIIDKLVKWYNDAIETQRKIWNKNRDRTLQRKWLENSSINWTIDLIEKESIKDWTEAEIENLYNFNKNLIDIPDWWTKNLEWKIINSHINLNRAIKILNDTIDISRKVCDAQHKWVWICK